ncbi:putative permease component of ABC transporter [Sulfobacillus acidophilus TPY]|uniref:Carbohydrate ABC transporter membrane protein 2, CUT1 family n=1 Tax=Sulfobacillus acidophilus (strain ATCC 700253 / DSM 10332 / NAL) TaxID=679936 RepID=G8TTM8_SULAD|nr:putative permease component of ABC transporter [Sulfobacillus acidophilus TPY]AEW05694.1 carbohydrate ABC transporter membrane protein 2, CUT1 family [Sulfobacillus acidophilus DSM 10332]
MMRRIALTVGGILISLWSLGPIYWALVLSLMNPVQLLSAQPSFVPYPATLRYFAQLLSSANGDNTSFLHVALSSIIETSVTTLITIVVATMAGYAFARYRFRGSQVLFLTIIATMALPVYAVIIPLFQLMTQLNLVGTYIGVILVEVSATLPLAIWLMRSFIASLPPSLEEAALIDGATHFTMIREIVLPLIGPGLSSTTIVVFLTTWSQFLIPLTFAPTANVEPLTVLITQFVSKYAINYGLQAAAGLLALLPPILVVLRFNRSLLRGLLTGAVTS